MERAKDLKKSEKSCGIPASNGLIEDDKGNKYARYTIQMFYLINSGVIDNEIKQGY
jgi:hypothetical protein